MSDTPIILLVDDDPMQRLMVKAVLEPQYGVAEAEDSETALMMIGEVTPALILMDIRLPGIDGFAACRQIKANDEFSEIPVIFLSGKLTLEDRLAAYDAGGEDFLPKPVAPQELFTKIALTLNNVSQRRTLNQNAREAFHAAMTAMSSASEMGTIMAALRQSFGCQNVQELAICILDACREFGLEACVRLSVDGQITGMGASGNLTPVESGVLEKLAEGDRIISLGRQSAYNYDGLTLLIKNMPADPEVAGRTRDNLMLLTEGSSQRLKSLEAEIKLKIREQTKAQMFAKATTALEDIQSRHQLQRQQTEVLQNMMISEMEIAFVGLGLTQKQEEVVAALVKGTAQQISSLYAQGLHIEEHLAAIRSGSVF